MPTTYTSELPIPIGPMGVFPSPLCFYKLNNFVLALWYHEAAKVKDGASLSLINVTHIRHLLCSRTLFPLLETLFRDSKYFDSLFTAIKCSE